jgi:hypothetical protein
MSLKSKTQSALTNLTPFATGTREIAEEEAGERLTATITALDTLALAFDHLTLVSQPLAGASIDELKKVADSLERRLTYLLEPIAPIEVDADGCVVQLRSNPPARDDNGTRYYELLVRRGGELSLRRYQKQPGGVRQEIPAHTTREVFLRLVGDMSDVAR